MYAVPHSFGRTRLGSPIRYIDGKAARYNSSHLTKSQWSSARQGINSNYHVHCVEGKYFVFYLRPIDSSSDPVGAKITIRPEGSKDEVPSCDCREYRLTDEACRHIFWLLDNILDYTSEPTDDPDGSFALRKDGHALSTHLGPYRQIQSLNLAMFSRREGWEHSSERSSRRDRGGLREERWPIEAQTRDLIRHLDQASEYSASQYSDEYLSGSPSLSGAVYRLATSNPEFFADLRKEASVESCTRSYLKRLERRIDGTFARWINYTKTGQPRLGYDDEMTDPNDGFGAPNVPWVASRLREFELEIERELYRRDPLPAEHRARAFRILLKMFENVASFHDLNVDDFHYRPQNVVTYNETERELNIYTRLIRRPSIRQDNDFFAISLMRRIADAGVSSLPTLLSYREMIHDSASRGYAEEFDALLYDIQNAQGR
ncbi:hypothetical protein ABW19_dt0201772 [Dactylella cylindrospora]|nr:hypothetical protein ABW19_dt0201772 [Dactylella cylindrospora]